MRNQIGIPPVERDADTTASLAPGSAGPKAAPRPSHAGMEPDVVEGARRGEGSHVGGFDKPVSERDTNVGLYIGLAIGVVALILVVMVFIAIF